MFIVDKYTYKSAYFGTGIVRFSLYFDAYIPESPLAAYGEWRLRS